MAPEPFRTPASRLLSALFLTAALIAPAAPAHALRIVNYNILNYPGSTGPARDPLYRTILSPLSPDIVCVQEMQSDAGCTEFLGSLNTMEPGQWTRAAFVNGNDTDCGLFFKSAKLQLIDQGTFYPNSANLLRLIHYFRLMPVGYSSPAAEIRVYALHLKASTGFEAQRLAEATGLRDTLNGVLPGTHSLVMGDYNLYTGTEPALTKLLESQVDNDGRLYDPLGFQGLPWQDNVTLQPYWTQSPCKTGDVGCASGAASGGIDDRFDLILPTLNWNDGVGLELVPGSYVAVGNDGLHHNNSIQDPPTIPEGAAYASALHSVSDHLPVRVDLRLPARATVPGAPLAFGTVIVGATASTTLAVANAAPAPGEALAYSYAASAGFTAPAGPQGAAAGVTNPDAIGMETSTAGAKSGSLAITSNSVEGALPSIALSGTVLRHAVASLDSETVVTAGSLDFGTHDGGGFTPLSVRLHNQGYDALQAGMYVLDCGITGGVGHFAWNSTAIPFLTTTGARYNVTFNDAGTTADSTYTATFTFSCADQGYPGAQPTAPVVVSLAARRQSGAVSVQDALPSATLLRAPTPNPLADESAIGFDLAQAGTVRLEAFDAAGRRVATILAAELGPGRYNPRWNGRGESGEPLGAGLYFVRLIAPGARPHAVRLAIVR
jgi:hypothetical protein